MTGQKEEAGRIPSLDGIRGIAIALVMMVHFTPDILMPNRWLEWMKKAAFSGWIGVDLFFVLSGMLITGILIKSRGRPRAARNFYARRFLRIAPLYLVSLVLVFGVVPFFVSRGEDPRFDAMRGSQAWYWVHCANVIVYLHGFERMMSDTVTLAHYWSLAVEEHFYFVWPLLVWRLSDRRLQWVTVGAILLAPGLRVLAVLFMEGVHLKGAFVQTPMRMDALAWGALIAVLASRGKLERLRGAALVIFPICAAALGGSFLLQKGLWVRTVFMRTIGLSLIGAMFAAAIVIVLTSGKSSPVERALTCSPLRMLGKYSYGLYVWHALFMPAFDRILPAPEAVALVGSSVLAAVGLIVVKVILSLAAALASWHLLEAPFLKLKERFGHGLCPAGAADAATPAVAAAPPGGGTP